MVDARRARPCSRAAGPAFSSRWRTRAVGVKLEAVTSTAKKILDEALALPDDERAALMEALSDSFEPEPVELSPEWKVEIESRIAQIERGEVETVPWDEVEAKIRRTLGKS